MASIPFPFQSLGQQQHDPEDESTGDSSAVGSSLPARALPGRRFTLEELRRFNGCCVGENKGEVPIYIALLGNVHDVSEAKRMYGPGGPYAMFAGRDATRGLAAFNLNLVDDSSDYSTLSQRHLDNAKHWQSIFNSKYPIVGELVLPQSSGHQLTSKQKRYVSLQMQKSDAEEKTVGSVPSTPSSAPSSSSSRWRKVADASKLCVIV